MRHPKFLLVLAVVLLIVTGFECAALGSRQNQEAGITALIEQWLGIERRFLEAGLVHGKEAEFVFEEARQFRRNLVSFLGSETYRIFRVAPFSSDAKSVIAPVTFNEIPEIQAAADLVPDFCEAVSKGETGKALLISADISGCLVKALIRSEEIEKLLYNAYLRLMLVFIIFIIITVFVIWYLNRALDRSHRREAEGSWFSRAILFAQEDERARISRELHDTIAQDLRWLSLDMDKIGNCRDAEERKKLCTTAADVHSALIRKVRDICDYLVPPDFRHQGLPDALRRLCLDCGKRMGIDCRIDIAENLNLGGMGEEKQLQIFRIVQEALTNVGKHAEAREAIVVLRSGPDGKIYAGVSDDGKGFRPPTGKDMFPLQSGEARFGIRGMNERAAMLGGSLRIKSERGEGTLVCLELPGGDNDRSIVS